MVTLCLVSNNSLLQKMDTIIQDKTFDKVNFTVAPLHKGEYENCSFINCDFSATAFAGIVFIDCSFTNCNLSLVKLGNTVLRDVVFTGCKMLGLHFETCNQYGLSVKFTDCTLNHSSFYKTKIKKTQFKNCQLHEIDLTECDLTEASFYNCDFAKAAFENTVLEKADFRTSYNFSIDPMRNRIAKAKFSLSSVAGLLGRYDIMIDGKS